MGKGGSGFDRALECRGDHVVAAGQHGRVEALRFPVVGARVGEKDLRDQHGKPEPIVELGVSPQTPMHMIGVYTHRETFVQQLRERCPAMQFSADEADRKSVRVAIVDDDSHSVLDNPGKNLVRLVLCDGTRPPNRRHGEIRVERGEFLSATADYLAFATELAETAVHAAQLEQELTYLNEIHELMAMVDADAVSERITTTVLKLLGLDRGTLFLHDPRLE